MKRRTACAESLIKGATAVAAAAFSMMATMAAISSSVTMGTGEYTPMPPVLGPKCRIVGALVVLRRSHGERLPGRDEAQKRALGARHALLDNHRGAGIAEGAVEAGAHGSLGIFHSFGHHNALARRQTVGLDDDGSACSRT